MINKKNTKNSLLKEFFICVFVYKNNYAITKYAIALSVKRVPKIIVVIWRTFSGPRFSYFAVSPQKLVIEREACLCCTRIIRTNKILKIICVIFRTLSNIEKIIRG